MNIFSMEENWLMPSARKKGKRGGVMEFFLMKSTHEANV